MGGGAQIVFVLGLILWLAVTLPVAVLIGGDGRGRQRPILSRVDVASVHRGFQGVSGLHRDDRPAAAGLLQ